MTPVLFIDSLGGPKVAFPIISTTIIFVVIAGLSIYIEGSQSWDPLA